MKKSTANVIKKFPHWVNPPEPNQDLHELEWGYMEVLDDKTLRFVEQAPDPDELEALIEQLQNQI
jgi:hypothetical protein